METQNQQQKVCLYFRVSTSKQGESGLGLEAQRETVERFIGNAERVGDFIEVESGKNSDRPKLKEAIALAKRTKAKLVIAKLDRLSRNVHFLSGLMESGVDFVAVDNPNANRLTLHILAAVAEDEARRISERTKAALGALKARGVPLGAARTAENLAKAKASGLLVRGNGIARSENAWIRPKNNPETAAEMSKRHLTALYSKYGPTTLSEIKSKVSAGEPLRRVAEWMNQQGYKTMQDCPWSAMAVSRIYQSLTRNRAA
jgi:DNA invertase Pin-like site-specific DNA recombinase